MPTTAVRTRGADLLLQSLVRAGVPRLYTLSGNHIMPVFDAALNVNMPLIHTRHEASTVHMADAHARLTGQVGVALVTGGPGHANAVSALYTAQMAESPVLLLSGHAPTTQLGMGAFQEMRQAEVAEPVCKASFTCQHVDQLESDVARAIVTAVSGRPGPVHLSLPTDVLEATSTSTLPSVSAGGSIYAPKEMPLPAQIARSVIEQLRLARRPLILTGPASMTRTGRALMAELQAALGVPVLGMESPRGIADGSLGAFAQVLDQADCVLLLGKRLDFTLKFGQAPAFPAAAQLLQIDAQADEIKRARSAMGNRHRLGHVADARSALLALTSAARSSADPMHGAWLAEVQAARMFRPPAWAEAQSAQPGRLHPVQMLAPLQAVLDSHPDAVLVADGGEIGQWATACLHAPHRVINGVAGAIGVGLPFALAARCVLPDAPVVAVMGDGSVGFHIAEFDTAVRYDLPFLAVVGNDARWNAEHQIQLRDYGADRLLGCELLPTRYDQVVQALGGHGEWVEQPAQMQKAIAQAQASGLPACINVMLQSLPAPQIRR